MNEPVEFEPCVLEVRSNDPERAADQAWLTGALGIEERPEALRVTYADGATASLAAASLETIGLVLDVTAEVDGDWVAHWARHATASVEPPFVIRPPWIENRALDQLIELIIDPGPTFGHGGHPTTRLLLRLLPAALTSPARVLDVGCGSGVLSVAAARLGADAVVAIDTDPAAVDVTIANAGRNGVDVTASTTPLADLDEDFDLVLVNVTASTMAELAADLRRVTADRLLVSGLRRGQEVPGLDDLRMRDEEDGWVVADLRCG